MGIAIGLAFDHSGNLYVGDRSGTIFKINPDRQIFVFATLEPSISAYHLAFSPSGELFVTGPTTSSFDRVYRISQGGEVGFSIAASAGRRGWRLMPPETSTSRHRTPGGEGLCESRPRARRSS